MQMIHLLLFYMVTQKTVIGSPLKICIERCLKVPNSKCTGWYKKVPVTGHC